MLASKLIEKLQELTKEEDKEVYVVGVGCNISDVEIGEDGEILIEGR